MLPTEPSQVAQLCKVGDLKLLEFRLEPAGAGSAAGNSLYLPFSITDSIAGTLQVKPVSMDRASVAKLGIKFQDVQSKYQFLGDSSLDINKSLEVPSDLGALGKLFALSQSISAGFEVNVQ